MAWTESDEEYERSTSIHLSLCLFTVDAICPATFQGPETWTPPTICIVPSICEEKYILSSLSYFYQVFVSATFKIINTIKDCLWKWLNSVLSKWHLFGITNQYCLYSWLKNFYYIVKEPHYFACIDTSIGKLYIKALHRKSSSLAFLHLEYLAHDELAFKKLISRSSFASDMDNWWSAWCNKDTTAIPHSLLFAKSHLRWLVQLQRTWLLLVVMVGMDSYFSQTMTFLSHFQDMYAK